MKRSQAPVSMHSYWIWRNTGTVLFRRTPFCRDQILPGWETSCWWGQYAVIWTESVFIHIHVFPQSRIIRIFCVMFLIENLEKLSKYAAKLGHNPLWMPEGGKGNSRLSFSTAGKMRNVFVQLWAGLSCRSYIKKEIQQLLKRLSDVFGVFTLACDLSANIGVGLRLYSAVSHQVTIKMFWLHVIHLYFPTDWKHKTFQSLCFIGLYYGYMGHIPLLEGINVNKYS